MNRSNGPSCGFAVFLIAASGTVPAPPRSKCSAPSACKPLWKNWSPKFEKASGHKLNITWATAALLVKRVQAGETADLWC